MFEIEIDLACRDWEEIPTEHIPDVCAEARKRSGSFLPSNGLVATVWRAAQAESRRPKSKPFTALPAPSRTKEEIKAIERLCGDMRNALGGARPKNWTP